MPIRRLDVVMAVLGCSVMIGAAGWRTLLMQWVVQHMHTLPGWEGLHDMMKGDPARGTGSNIGSRLMVA